MLKSLGQRIATSYRVKIGGLSPEKKLKRGRQGNSEQDYWQPPVKWDHFRICMNQRDASGNFVVAKDLMEKYGEKPRAINIVFHSNKINDIYNDWRAAYKGRKCLCRSDDGEIAYWNTELDKVHPSLTKVNPQPEGLRKSIVAVECPEEDCPLTKGGSCKINLILRFMILEAPSIGGAADFRATSINSALQIRASLNQIAGATNGRFAGIPLQLKLEPRTGEHGVVHVVHIEYPQGLLELKKDAAETSAQMLEFDETIAHALSVSKDHDFKDEAEAASHVAEFYPEVAEKDDVIIVDGKEVPEEEVEKKLEKVAEDTAAKNAEAIETLWQGDEAEEEDKRQEEGEAEQEVAAEPERGGEEEAAAPEKDEQLNLENLF